MSSTSTHLEVPSDAPRERCLGPDGSAERVIKALAPIRGRWKLPILFRLFPQSTTGFLALLRDLPGISHKVLTQNLRELEADGLVDRVDHGSQPRRVDYALSARGRALRPILVELRDFASGST